MRRVERNLVRQIADVQLKQLRHENAEDERKTAPLKGPSFLQMVEVGGIELSAFTGLQTCLC